MYSKLGQIISFLTYLFVILYEKDACQPDIYFSFKHIQLQLGKKRDISKQDYVHLADSYNEQQTWLHSEWKSADYGQKSVHRVIRNLIYNIYKIVYNIVLI